MKATSGRWILVAACVVTAIGAGVAIAVIRTQRPDARPAAPAAAVAVKPILSAVPDRPFLMFISLAPDTTFTRLTGILGRFATRA